MKKREILTRRYIFSWKQIREALAMEGEFKTFDLWSGRSPYDREKSVPSDVDEYYFDTEEGSLDE